MRENNRKLRLKEIGLFLEKLAEKSESVYWLSSPDLKKIQYISPAYEKIWGRSRKTLYQKPELWITYLHPDSRKNYHPIHNLAKKITQLGPKARYEENYQIIRPDGEIRWISDKGFPIYDEDGNCCGITGIAVDVSKEKKIEETLNIAKEKAEAANKAKSEFVAAVTHDLRTPLCGIKSVLQYFSSQLKSTIGEHKDILKTMEESNNMLLMLVDDILDFAKLEAGKMELISKPINLQDVIEHTLINLSSMANKKKLNIILDYQFHQPRLVITDGRRISQILMNLIGNAIKFTNKGHILVSVNCISQNNKETIMKISVTDTGIGISKDKLKVIFDKFTQLEPSYHNDYHGTGLGLAIVQQLTNNFGGKIGVKSESGKGSTFWITLPLSLQKSTRKNSFDYSLPKSSRILIIDDNAMRAEITRKQISLDNSNIVTTKSKYALKTLNKNLKAKKPFSIIMIDDEMIDSTPEKLIQLILAQEEFKKTKIILSSKPINNPKKEAMKKMGFATCLIKPIMPSELLNMMLKLLKPKHLRNSQK